MLKSIQSSRIVAARLNPVRRLFCSSSTTAASSRKTIDLRSDTVTKPNAAVTCAMMDAVTGDDVMGEDPAINALEKHCAKLLGKEAAVFVPTGTMGNLVCIAAITASSPAGSEIIVGNESHVYHYEQGGVSSLLSLAFNVARNAPDGTIPLQELQAAIREDDPHYARTSAILIENTQNRCGGRVLPLQYLQDVKQMADEHALPVHVDGARLMNAAVALGCDVARLTEHCSTVSMCFSKGLGAPVGSIVAGSSRHMAQARRTRKMLGGGMRQAGVLAAAASLCLKEHPPLLEQDHRNARSIARALARSPRVRLDAASVETNIIYFDTPGIDANAVVQACLEQGVLISAYGTNKLRLVTHLQVSQAQAERATDVLLDAIEQAGAHI